MTKEEFEQKIKELLQKDKRFADVTIKIKYKYKK